MFITNLQHFHNKVQCLLREARGQCLPRTYYPVGSLKWGIETKPFAMLATITYCDDLQWHIVKNKIAVEQVIQSRNHVSPLG